MKTNAQFAFAVLCLASLFTLAPIDTFARRQGAQQRAGEVSRIIPAVTITRGTSSVGAAEKTVVDWQDILNTQSGGRARVSLDDGSLLNVGSDSVLQVIKHDAAGQQTALELVSGKMRIQAKKLTLPGAKFEVKTPSGIAGVVGTDFYIGYDDNQMTVVVFEGKVKVCNLAGICVEALAGQMTTVHSGDSSGPSQPSQATESAVSGANATTSLENVMANPPLGMVAKSLSARVGNNAANDGETVFSGDLLSTQDGGSLQVRVGSVSLQLEGNSSAYIFRTPYGGIVELLKGGAVYEKPDGPQNLVIVASDVRVTPVLNSPGMGRIRLDDPCKIGITVQRGEASVRVGTESKLIGAGKSFRVAAEYAVTVQEARSPEADDYHSSHYHRPCAGTQQARGRPPIAPGHSKFIYLATGTAIAVTLIPTLEALESPNRP
jgi:ferric-dicitrate binding protein FerR (iron transport regulator)